MMDGVADESVPAEQERQAPVPQPANPYMTAVERRADAIGNYDEALRALRNGGPAVDEPRHNELNPFSREAMARTRREHTPNREQLV